MQGYASEQEAGDQERFTDSWVFSTREGEQDSSDDACKTRPGEA